jgi:3-oxoacyl-[acyl-carrier-protein] synthase III
MKIAALAHRVPSRLMTNADMIEMVDRCNPDLLRPRKAAFFRAVRALYGRLGARTRYIRDLDAGEKAADIILGALDDALIQAGMRPEDVELLIYCGVGRGFLEPANAYFYAQARMMHRANCFDVTDACMSWVRALQIVNLMLGAGTVRNAVVINGEFHLGIHDNWKIESLDSLSYNFPMFTIGEAATATVLLPSDQQWRFDYDSRPELADLCTIPLPGYAEFVPPSNRIGLNGPNKFVSFGRELFEEGARMMGGMIQRCIPDRHAHRWYFPHAPARTIYESLLPTVGVPKERIYLGVFPQFGNVVSASIPLGMSLAQRDGVLERGDSVAFVPISAGMVASIVQTVF